MGKSVTAQWFEIDKKTHGSIAIYTRKEVFKKLRAARDETRGEANETGITMFLKSWAI